jgi:hypothetical protein
VTDRRLRCAATAASAALVALSAACSSESGPAPTPIPPPPPPAACLLDTGALTTATGISWTPNAATASDTRCVYDPVRSPAPAADGPAFVAVDVAAAPGADPAGTLDTVGALCTTGSRAPVAEGQGFVCRFQGDSVFAATVRGDRLVTVAASAIPPGTTAAQLVLAFDQQLSALAR